MTNETTMKLSAEAAAYDGPEHVFVFGILLTDADQAALLPMHRLCFPSFGTVVEDDASMVWGGLVKLDGDGGYGHPYFHLRRYDGVEGYIPDAPDRSFYTRKIVTVYVDVDDEGGTPVEAWVYEMRPERRGDQPNRYPDDSLADRMRCQYDRLGMPPAAYAQLPEKVTA